MLSPADAVNRWIGAFRSVWTACGSVNTIVKQVHWNPFANTTTGTYLMGAANQTAFKSALQQQFSLCGLSDISIDPVVSTSETFAAYTVDMLGDFLHPVFDLVAGSCPPGAPCFDVNGLVPTTPLPVAFPAGVGDSNWISLLNAVAASNLDNLIAATAIATARNQVVDPTKTIQDLILTLSTI